MANGKPICGSQGESTDDTLTFILFALGLLGTIIGIVQGAAWTVAQAQAVTLLGITAPGGVWLGGVGGGVLVLVIVFGFYFKRCLEDPDGLDACSAGVVNGIVESFDSPVNEVFPFTAMHDRVDVVVKSIYWNLVQENAQFVKCAGDPDASPVLQGFYYSDEVCAAALGATIGAAAGAVVGIIVAAAIAAIGCATIILCILAILVAALIAAGAALAGAFIGGQIGKAIAGDSDPTATGGNTIQTGDYVTTKGNLITSGDFDGARVYWFVEETTLHGRSTGAPQFSFTDPDTNLIDDACPHEVPPIG
jgi:hypothetical protein